MKDYKKMKSYLKTILTSAALGAFSAFGGTVHEYTSAQIVSEVISGDDSVRINIPNACTMGNTMTGWKIVEFNANNSFSGDVEVLSGCVAITNHPTALGTGRIKMSPGTAILVKVDFSSLEGGLKQQIIDRIDVVGDNLSEDTWVGFMIFGDGLKNNVDFSGQPYLYLSAPKHLDGYTNAQENYSKTFTPYGDTYKFGCNFVKYSEAVGLTIGNLVDKDADTPRKVVIRNGCVTFGANIKLTGGVTVKKDGVLAMTSSTTFTAPAELKENFFDFEDGSRFNPRTAAISFPANYGWRFNGTVQWYPSGNAGSANQIKFNGPVAGSGRISCDDNGCFVFLSDNNTFTGNFYTWNVSDRSMHIIIGDNTVFSMGNVAFGFNSSATAPAYLHLRPKDSGSSFKLSYQGTPVVTVEGTGSMALDVGSDAKVASTTVSFDPLKIAAGKTYTFNDRGGYVARITGEGMVALADGAAWPKLDFRSNDDGYSLYVATNHFSGAEVICPENVSLKMGVPMGASDAIWKFNSDTTSWQGHNVHCFLTNYDGRAAFVLDDGCHWSQYGSASGGIVYNKKVDMSKVFAVDFDFYAESSGGGSLGDSFCFALQDKYTSYYGQVNDDTGCKVDGSVSLAGSANKKKIFVTYNKAVVQKEEEPLSVTNPFGLTSYLFNNFTKTYPLHVKAVWDLTDLVFTLTWVGKEKDPITLTYSGADLATKFPQGAYFSFYSSAGGWYCRKIIDSVTIVSAENPVFETPGTGMTLKLDSTAAVFAEDGADAFAGALSFKGENTVTASRKAVFTNGEWSFDCTDGESSVTFGAGVTLPANVEVTVEGDLKGWHTLVDFSETGMATSPDFTESSGNYKCRVRDGKFEVYGKIGAVLLVK